MLRTAYVVSGLYYFLKVEGMLEMSSIHVSLSSLKLIMENNQILRVDSSLFIRMVAEKMDCDKENVQKILRKIKCARSSCKTTTKKSHRRSKARKIRNFY